MPKQPAKKTKAPAKRLTAKHTVKKEPSSVAVETSTPRKLKEPKRKWYHFWKRRRPVPNYEPLPKARVIFRTSIEQLFQNWKLFSGIVAIYGILNVILVRGVSSSSDLTTIKAAFDSLLHGAGGKVASALISFSTLLTSSGSNNSAASGTYQSFLLVVASLAFIWALRQTIAKNVVTIRDSFYRGMYPLIPVMLVVIVMGIQLLPLGIGGALYSTVVSKGIAIFFWEKLIWGIIFGILALWSIYMLCSSLFALYIVTLPDMTPFRALRSARQLVYGRRLLILRKLIFLPVVMLLLATLIEVPLILFLTPLAPWVFFVLSMAALAIVHSYLFNLYRELL